MPPGKNVLNVKCVAVYIAVIVAVIVAVYVAVPLSTSA